MHLSAITPIVLTLNEEANIGRTLAALHMFSNIIVMDSESTDDTAAIASSFANVRLTRRPFDTHAAQWNAALKIASSYSEWVLALDADYLISPAFIDELASLPSGICDAYTVRFLYCIAGRPLRSSLYPPHVVLFRAAAGTFYQDGHTQRLRVSGTVGTLNAPILHDDRKSLNRWIQNQSAYAALEAATVAHDTRLRLRTVVRRRPWLLTPFAVFFHTLFVKGVIRDGKAGLVYAYERAIAEMLIAVEVLRRDLTQSSS